MSKNFKSLLLFGTAFLQILQIFTFSSAQDINATIKIDDTVRVEGRFAGKDGSESKQNFSFMADYAGVKGLGERISEMELRDRDGKTVNFRKVIASEFLAEREFESFGYSVAVGSADSRPGAVHTSFLDQNGGILFAEDLLPITQRGVQKVRFELPTGWKIFTNNRPNAASEFEVTKSRNGVFAIGPDWREKTVSEKGSSLKLLLKGEWLFTDDEAEETAAEIFKQYTSLFGSAPGRGMQIAVSKYSGVVPPGRWAADSRGANITILSSDMPFKLQSIQLLHEQMRHEIFHLWIPNGVALTGNYDWFYEGFALYQSLKIGLAVNRIRFEDFLATLSQAYYFDSQSEKRLSLIDASKQRFSGESDTIYARGLLVAFLCDLAILNESGGKRSVGDISAEVYSRYRHAENGRDGNDALLSIIRSRKELIPIADRYITGAERLDGAAQMEVAGIRIDRSGRMPKLTVEAKPTRKQRTILDALGYNNWRKLSRNDR